ncbi:MAG: sugar ABC transporter permease, partial [Thermoleophilia bacterium]|nr:sugar ABC transporter permease [Thermoleophilia bacterium]
MPDSTHPVIGGSPIPDAAVAFSPKVLWRRLLQGELGSVRVTLGIVIIWTIFAILNDRFLTSQNLSNLFVAIAAVGTISIGVVFVLLLGEIDLSVGTVSGVSAAVMAVLNTQHGWGGWPSIAAALAVGITIGLLQGTLITFFGIPAFVVTLAGQLIWLGLLLKVLGSTGTVNINDASILSLTGTTYSDTVGWVIGAIIVAGFLGLNLMRRRTRTRGGLVVEPMLVTGVKVGVVAIAIAAVIYLFNDFRGLPLAVVILIGLVVFFEFVVKRTTFGRHVLAVGGNAEAARRSGIKVQRTRLLVFTIASTLAAAGGVLAASRLFAVSQSSGQSDLLLLAIAGPVIVGTSLFGGGGSVWSALHGAIVIGSISNGMDLLAVTSDRKYMITGGVLMLA